MCVHIDIFTMVHVVHIYILYIYTYIHDMWDRPLTLKRMMYDLVLDVLRVTMVPSITITFYLDSTFSIHIHTLHLATFYMYVLLLLQRY